jgi:hypothetical protein
MYLFEFNNLDLDIKYNFVWGSREEGVGFKCFRDEGDYRYVLFDCGSFFAEQCILNGEVISIEGFELTDDRLNLYIDFVVDHKDGPKY